MKNFYREGRGLPFSEYISLIKSLSIFEIRKAKDENLDKELCSEDLDGYTSYLASQIFEYQLRLKAQLKESELINKNKLKEDKIRKICQKLYQNGFYNIYNSFTYNLNCLIIIIIFLFSNFSATPLHAQGDMMLKDIKKLSIGDTIHDELWNIPLQVVNHPDGKDTITLNDFRDKKLIILDFWSTYCGSCYYTFPTTFKKVAPYKDEIVLLPMTYQERQIVEKAVKKNSYLQSIEGFYSVVNSLWFRSMFGIDWFPQLIILDNKGKILGHLRPNHLNEENILKLLNNQLVIFPKISNRKMYSIFSGKRLAYVTAERRGRLCVI